MQNVQNLIYMDSSVAALRTREKRVWLWDFVTVSVFTLGHMSHFWASLTITG